RAHRGHRGAGARQAVAGDQSAANAGVPTELAANAGVPTELAANAGVPTELAAIAGVSTGNAMPGIGYSCHFARPGVMTSQPGTRALREQGQLAAAVAIEDHTMRLGDAREREGLGHEDPQGPLGGEPGQVQSRGAADLGAGVRPGRATDHLDAGLEAL